MAGVLGVDVGGSSIKYAAVDPGSGRLLTPLGSISTPQPGDAEQLVSAISGLARRAAPDMPVGVALPCVIRQGVVFTAANLLPPQTRRGIRNFDPRRRSAYHAGWPMPRSTTR